MNKEQGILIGLLALAACSIGLYFATRPGPPPPAPLRLTPAPMTVKAPFTPVFEHGLAACFGGKSTWKGVLAVADAVPRLRALAAEIPGQDENAVRLRASALQLCGILDEGEAISRSVQERWTRNEVTGHNGVDTADVQRMNHSFFASAIERDWRNAMTPVGVRAWREYARFRAMEAAAPPQPPLPGLDFVDRTFRLAIF